MKTKTFQKMLDNDLYAPRREEKAKREAEKAGFTTQAMLDAAIEKTDDAIRALEAEDRVYYLQMLRAAKEPGTHVVKNRTRIEKEVKELREALALLYKVVNSTTFR